tara:strand:- start:1715 stop:2029 length:315 start_codon:yes stop_codon:yes gene_type:complete
MVIRKILTKLSDYTEGINLRKFKVVSRQCLNDPSNSHKILKKEFFKEMRDVAIRQIKEENKNFNKMTPEEKEELIAQREKDLWQKVKSGGTTAFALIFGISIGN